MATIGTVFFWPNQETWQNQLAMMDIQAVARASNTLDMDALYAANHANVVKPGQPLEVLCAGLSKTGTMSLYSGLAMLGYKTYHMVEVIRDPQRAKDWKKVLEQELRTGNVDGVDFSHFYDGFTAATDSPSSDYFYEISKQYPDCKIILTHRDPDAWLNSFIEVMQKPHHKNPWHRAAAFWMPALWHVLKMVDQLYLVYDKRYGAFDRNMMQKRIDEVKAKIPAERLLVWKVQEGWEPLCEFLGKPVPEVPFPRINDGPTLKRLFNTITLVGMSMWAATAAVIAGLGYWSYNNPNRILDVLSGIRHKLPF